MKIKLVYYFFDSLHGKMMGVNCCVTEVCTAIIPKFQAAVNKGYDKCYTTTVTRKVVLPHDCYIPAGFFTAFGFT
jgi:hypothetical protein